MASIRKSSLIEGLWRKDIPEYPAEAIREAVVNAVAHRDYSHCVRGSYVQVRLFADRFEIQSPGGLYGNVTTDTLEEEHSTRNRLLMRFMEDVQLAENRGSGIRSMISAMRAANLEPPRFDDKRNSFWVTFRNHTLMGPEAVCWLNQFADRPLNSSQRVALAYLRHNERVTNSEYRRLNHTDSATANRDLRGLVKEGLVDQHKSRRWAFYTLAVSSNIQTPLAAVGSAEQRILNHVRQAGTINNSACRDLLGVDSETAHRLLKSLSDQGLLQQRGRNRGTKYVLQGKA